MILPMLQHNTMQNCHHIILLTYYSTFGL